MVRRLTVRQRAQMSRPVALVALALLVFGVVLCGSTPARAASAWLAPVDLTAPDGTASYAAVAMSASGDATAAWVDPCCGTGSVVVRASSRPAGGRFEPPVSLSSSGFVSDPKVAEAASGEALVVWSRDGAHSGVWWAGRPAGGAFGGASPIATGTVGEVGLVMNRRGDALVTWLAPVAYGSNGWPASWVVRAAYRPAGAAGFGSPVDISLPDANSPVGAIDASGRTVIMWYQSDRSEVESASDFGAPTSVGSSSGPPALVADPAGDAFAAWNGQNQEVIHVAGRRAGGSFVPVATLAPAYSVVPGQLALDSSARLTVAWSAEESGMPQVSDVGFGGPLGPTAMLPSPLPGGSSPPVIAIARDGTALVTWAGSYDSGDDRLVGAIRRPGGDFGQAVPVCNGPSGAPSPGQTAFDDTGNALVLCEWAGGVQYAAYDASGPQLRSLAVPDSATAGRPLTVSVAPVDVWSGVAHVVWEFGDGHQAVGASADNTYADPGRYTVKVTAIDRLGNRTSASREIRVAPAPTRPATHPTVACRRARRSLDSARARYRRALAAFQHHRTRRRLAVVHRIQRQAAAARRVVRNHCH